jgi:hypothetical protein
VTANEFYASDPRRECCDRAVGACWRIDGTGRTADVRWFAETGELVVVDAGDYAVWAVGCDEAAVEALLRDDVTPPFRPLSWLRQALDGHRVPRPVAASPRA